MPQLHVLKKARSFSELEGMFSFSELELLTFSPPKFNKKKQKLKRDLTDALNGN